MALNHNMLIHYETHEARVLREAYNLGRSSTMLSEEDVEKISKEMGLDNVQESLELPTAAGSVMLDLSELAGGGDQLQTSYTLQSKPLAPTRNPRLTKEGHISFEDSPQQTGAVDISDGSKDSRQKLGSGYPVPPLTAEEAKARATRTAMLAEYAFHQQNAKSRQSVKQFDHLLSA